MAEINVDRMDAYPENEARQSVSLIAFHCFSFMAIVAPNASNSGLFAIGDIQLAHVVGAGVFSFYCCWRF